MCHVARVLVVALLLAAIAQANELPTAKSASTSTKAIDEALASKVTLDFVDTPLADVLTFLAKEKGVPLVIDKNALSEQGLEVDYAVTMGMRNISLQAALNLLLRDAGKGLGWTIRNEVLLVTTKDAADTNLQLKVYNVRDLVVFDNDLNGLADYDTLIDAITSTIAPVSWDDVGGPASMKRCDLNGVYALVVSQTPEIHGQIESLLAELRKLKAVPK